MVLEGCVEKLHDELEYNRSLLKHIGRNVIFEPAGNERGAKKKYRYIGYICYVVISEYTSIYIYYILQIYIYTV